MISLYESMTARQRQDAVVAGWISDAMEDEDSCEDCGGTIRNREQLIEYERRVGGSLKTETVFLCEECVPRCPEDGCNAVRHPLGEGGCIDHEIAMWEEVIWERVPGDPYRIEALTELTKLQAIKGRS